MSDIAIRVENLSKQYRIGGPQVRYKTIRESLTQAARAPFRRLSAVLRGQSSVVSNETIWALKDVSFEVKRGEVVGVIGRNGAGKTTLLKILSRITEPTEGRVRLRGRVGSLLEVGTGFHPELTGRENIYLNGAILGMKREEIERKFDEMVAFSEIEKFIDTPVKHYSSGMYVRLAFAVAAHLEPEILLVDEVLAVGDAAFQKKCLGKMGDVASEGRTVLFVSHNMAAIQALCGLGLLLDAGRIHEVDRVDRVVDAYMRKTLNQVGGTSSAFPVFSRLHGIGISDCAVRLEPNSSGSWNLEVCLKVESNHYQRNVGVGLSISTVTGFRVSVIAPSVTNYVIEELEGSCQCVFRCDDIDIFLGGGDYVLDVWLSKPRVEYMVRAENAAVIAIPPRDVFSSGEYFDQVQYGIVPLPFMFSVRSEAPRSISDGGI